jgi:hypothetical protein
MTLRCKIGTLHFVNLPNSFKKRKRSYSTFIPYIQTKILAYMKPILYLHIHYTHFLPPKLSAVPSPN